MTIDQLQKLKATLTSFEIKPARPTHEEAEEMLTFLETKERVIFRVAQQNIQTHLGANQDVRVLAKSLVETREVYDRVHEFCMTDVIDQLDKKIQGMRAASKIEYHEIRALRNQVATLTGYSPTQPQIDRLNQIRTQIVQKQLEREQFAPSTSSPTIPIGTGIGRLSSELLLNVFSYCGYEAPLRRVNRLFHQTTDNLLYFYWSELKKASPQGIVDMPTLMQSIEERLAGRSYFFLFKALENEFLGATLPDGRLPVTPSDFQALQRQATEYDHALRVTWECIKKDAPIYLPSPNTAKEIRQWLNNPANANAINQIRTLWMGKRNLRVLPKEISKLTQLRYLRLHQNNLISLPDYMRNLTQLKTLDLAECRLTSVPDFVGCFTQLESLNLEHNQLVSLPESIGNLTQLQELRLNHNRITSLPDSIGHLSHLKLLQLRRNTLTSLPVSLTQLSQLVELNLERNPLNSLPDSFGNLTQLRELFLYNNNLISLPDSLGNLNVRMFDVRNNQFMFLPDSILNSKNKAITSNEGIINFIDELQFPSTSYLGKLLQMIMRRKDQAQIKAFFDAPEFAKDRSLIFEMLSKTEEPLDAFEDMTRFYFAVRQAILTKFEHSPKNQVYNNLILLDKSIDSFYAQLRALVNLPRLADAMEMLDSREMI